MPRYELDGKRGTQIEDLRITGKTVHRRSGYAGAKQKTLKTTYQTERAAASRFARAIEGVRKKGFVHASERQLVVDNPALERAITEHPDDDGPRLVYADWLLEQGDPRGELAAV